MATNNTVQSALALIEMEAGPARVKALKAATKAGIKAYATMGGKADQATMRQGEIIASDYWALKQTGQIGQGGIYALQKDFVTAYGLSEAMGTKIARGANALFIHGVDPTSNLWKRIWSNTGATKKDVSALLKSETPVEHSEIESALDKYMDANGKAVSQSREGHHNEGGTTATDGQKAEYHWGNLLKVLPKLTDDEIKALKATIDGAFTAESDRRATEAAKADAGENAAA